MTLFTEEQAIAAYEIADIVRSLDDSGNGEGIWEIIFVMDGRPYSIKKTLTRNSRNIAPYAITRN